ncbi:bifunctional DNA-formamidopyrimidine glycosylase/DNA-(apurinic or apyrimidinic site) lyase [Candidatus Endoriftia persephonae]|jgi:formamidopyrimidine-DNA glycosylase|uniref:Formamidopyrimidine-DNA glycosylase n=3 Tax=Gammaproteobacteria TaxID=1236 RepID=G2FEF8_9GAMM|nr:bifunctional DNA-formamidopyrimidine glycosylase/DNA-(apurinic or apyrimidinic site) lyase [Candidatus Endoriftia persephone]EGW54727.1 formamidopyrimidine-DNA glycosylase [endosymbiont of Tevnia jerichonana (vent Tica)]USF87252.1 bifunctional DNA-formamidopyrimidine glycosylase/DNA-(apurinic or apyrimidinic site) lyase [Candidatus Endoriftia persephone]
MPELPEVETTRRGIAPHLEGAAVSGIVVRQPRLRWPVPENLSPLLNGQRLNSVGRRGKYLLLNFAPGSLLLHLGMSGSLRVLPNGTPPQRHDHFDLEFDNNSLLRLRDPRRFGAVLWQPTGECHELLARLGLEPLREGFDGDYLHQIGQSRSVAIKQLIMESRVVVGVGNIYANESLFRAGIHPQRAANRIALARYQRLAAAIVEVLNAAIAQGGTTLRDFQQEDGSPGYFAQQLQVYGRTGEPCPICAEPIRLKTLGQRSSFYCPLCQR